MKLLLDTHVLLWALSNDRHLTAQARRLIEEPDNKVYYSVVSPWEVQMKHDRHPDELTIGAKDAVAYCRESGFLQLPVRLEHVLMLDSLVRREGSPPHQDPFDRMLICQASHEGMLLLTHDKRLAEYEEPCVFAV